MPKNKPVPPLDSRKISFPSDTVTLGQIRKEDPAFFTDPMEPLRHTIDDLQILMVLGREMAVAKRAYALAMGQPDPYPDKHDPFVDVSHLNAEYRHFKLSTGMHQTKQFVRDIETAAKQQAEQHLRHGR